MKIPGICWFTAFGIDNKKMNLKREMNLIGNVFGIVCVNKSFN
jgi:hypothetical protein